MKNQNISDYKETIVFQQYNPLDSNSYWYPFQLRFLHCSTVLSLNRWIIAFYVWFFYSQCSSVRARGIKKV